MSTINVNWPKDANGNTYSINDWIQTLSAEEQDEWHYANNEHNQMVVEAAANSDVELTPNTVQWKSKNVWHWYQEKYLTPEIKSIEEKYWTRFLDAHNLKRSDIFQTGSNPSANC